MFQNLDRRMKLLGLVWGVVFLVFALGILAACAPKPADLVATETENVKLENLQLKQQIAFAQAQQMVDNYNLAQKAVMDECNGIVKAHKWPEGTTCGLSNPNNMASKLVFKAPEKKADAKPAAKGK